MNLLCSKIYFTIEKNETLKPLVAECGYSIPTVEDPHAYKDGDGFRIQAYRLPNDSFADYAVFEIGGVTLTDVSLGYADVLSDLEKVGLYKPN